MTSVESSKFLARLLGPALCVLSATEAKNSTIWSQTDSTLVYLNGTILFVCGWSVILNHYVWTWNWRVLNTSIGCLMMGLGLYRMISPNAPQADWGIGTYSVLFTMFTIASKETPK
ncbi:hypothetical protein HK096_008716 [Nowakowskiella sp. JEL0078]|nr:hypothetical protein HK096_008716 [Nowakowskiella sp. JEL0078]